MTMKTNLMICLMAFSVALAGYMSCLIASHIHWGVGLVSAPAILPGLTFGLAIAAWLLHREWITRGKAVGLAVASAVAYFAAYWSAFYLVTLCGRGMLLSTVRLALFHAGMIAGLVGTALLGASLAAVSADFRRKDWKTLILIGAAAGGALCLAGIGAGASSNDRAGTLANPGDRVFIFVWQLLVSGYIGMLLLTAPDSAKPAERGRLAPWATRAVLVLLVASFVQAAIGYSRGDEEKEVTTSANEKSDGNAAAWANKYRNAKFISRAEFLKTTGPVSLMVRQRSGVRECVANLEQIVRASASANGWTLAATPTHVELVVDADINRSKITTTEHTDFGVVEHGAYHMAFIVAVQVGFRMKVNCQRGDKFVQMDAYPYRHWNTYYYYMGDLVDFDAAYVKGFRQALDWAFENISTIRNADDVDDQATWSASLWPASQDAQMYKSFVSPLTSEPGAGDHSFYGVTKLDADLELLDEADKNFNIASLQQSWMAELNRNGHELNSSSDMRVQHQFGAFGLSRGWLLGGTLCNFDLSAIRVWQKNVIFPFNGELRRGKVCVWSDVTTAIALPRDHGNTARDLMNRSIRSAATELALRR